MRIYDAPNGASPLWTEKLNMTFADGYFSAMLGGSSTLKGVFDGSDRHIGAQVDADAEMTPRVAINSVPYAMMASNVIGDMPAARVEPAARVGRAEWAAA